MANTVRRERGTATAELALALPAVALLIGVVLAVGSVVTAQIRCLDAARAAARQAARGETSGAVVQVARAAAPSGAAVSATRSADQVRVEVNVAVRVPLIGVSVIRVRGVAVAGVEQP